MNNFKQIDYDPKINLLLEQIETHPELWDEHKERRIAEGTPHSEMADIWVRFRAREELTEPIRFYEPHISVWYPAKEILTEVERIALDLLALYRATQLGGILITKIPPGGEIKPHHDRGGWHAEFFNTKVYIPLKSNLGCLNTCEEDEVNMKMGEVWEFDNLKVHSVKNSGDTDRVTLIITMRRE